MLGTTVARWPQSAKRRAWRERAVPRLESTTVARGESPGRGDHTVHPTGFPLRSIVKCGLSIKFVSVLFRASAAAYPALTANVTQTKDLRKMENGRVISKLPPYDYLMTNAFICP